MTTRFSLADLAEMFNQPITGVREAVEQLAKVGQLSAESFTFGERIWRIAPSDTRKIQDYMDDNGLNTSEQRTVSRNVHRKQVIRKIKAEESSDSSS